MKLRHTDPGCEASRVQGHFWRRGRAELHRRPNTKLRRGTLQPPSGRRRAGGCRVNRRIPIFPFEWFTVPTSTLPIKPPPWSIATPPHTCPPPHTIPSTPFSFGDKTLSTSARWHLLSGVRSINTHEACVRSQLLIANTAKHHRIASRRLWETHVPPWLLFHPRANIKREKILCS